jgi:group I intron endonuclease
MASGIYCIQHGASGRRYVGSAANLKHRWQTHVLQLRQDRHHSKFLQRCWDKYGEAAFSFRVLLLCDRANLLTYEQAVIDAWKPEFNSAPTAGSQLGFRHRPESKARMSEAAKRTRNFTGHRHSEATKRRISENRKGKGATGWTQQRRDRISAAHKGRIITPEQRSKISATLTGHKQGPEQIAKRVAKLRGRKMPDGFAQMMSERMTGRTLSTETVEKIARAKAKLSDDQVREVRNLLANGAKQSAVSRALGVGRATVADIGCGRKYRWVAL